MKCSFCGKEYLRGSKCPACGHAKEADDATAEKPVYATGAVVADNASSSEEKLFALCESAMTVILGATEKGISKGTGYYIKFNEDTYCITNFHVIDNAQAIVATFAKSVDKKQEKYNVDVLAVDMLNDLALLKLSADIDGVADLPNRKYLRLIDNMDDVRIGQKVCTVGNPREFTNILSVGRVSGIGSGTAEALGNPLSANRFLVNMTVTHGNSGGAVCNYKGEVIGMATAIRSDLPNQTVCVSAFAVRQLVASYINKNKKS